jgi:serine/threonine-protein kinase
LESIIIKCVQRDPNDRYQSMAELLYDLDHYHELDSEYRRSQNRKWRLFLSAAVLTVISVIGIAGFAFAEQTQLRSSYDAVLQRAREQYGSGSLQAAAPYYIQAVTLDPANESAYGEFLDIVKRDQALSEEESTILIRMLNEYSSGTTTNRDVFKSRNQAAFDAFAYDLGITYYFAYNGQGDKRRAEDWLTIAASSETMDAQNKELARRLAFVAANYDRFLNPSTTGNPLLEADSFNARDFWTEMVALSDGDLVAVTGSSFASIGVYHELIYEVSAHTPLFMEGGVTQAEMLEQLSKAEDALGSLRTSNASEQETISTALEQIEPARAQVQTTFGNRGFSGGGSSS